MTRIKLLLILIITSFMMADVNAQIRSKTSVKDFEQLVGSWQGSLTYLDYSSGKPYTMSADVEIRKIDKTNRFSFSNIYVNEKNANSIDTVAILEAGKYIDKELVISRRKLVNDDIEIITRESGKDGNDNKQATIRHTYTFGKITFTNRKDVQFAGEKVWINRHVYSYTRRPVLRK